MRFGLIPPILWAFGSLAAARLVLDRSLQGVADVLGEDFFISFGGFNVTSSFVPACQVEYELLTVCVTMECANFVVACPNNNESAEIVAEPASCKSIDKTICETFNIDGCCMNACAFELQVLALCVGDTNLTCTVPSCHKTENQTNQTNHTGSASNCFRDGARYSCTQMSNITSGGEVKKLVQSTIDCAYDEHVGFDITASSDCMCVGAVLTSNISDALQLCECDLCQQSTAEFVSLDCSMNPDDPFVVGQCTNQSCSGACAKEKGENGTETTQTLEQSAIPSSSPSAQPSSTQNPQTNAPSLAPFAMPSISPSAASALPSVSLTNTTQATNTTLSATMAPTTAIASPSLEPTRPPPRPTAFPKVSLLPSQTLFPVNRTRPPESAVPSLIAPKVDLPSTQPTTWYNDWPAYDNFTEAPLNPTTESSTPIVGSNNETLPSNSTDASGSPWYKNDAFITVVGAYLALCTLVCLLVHAKRGNYEPVLQVSDEEARNRVVL